jgi:hypothetical protein
MNPTRSILALALAASALPAIAQAPAAAPAAPAPAAAAAPAAAPAAKAAAAPAAAADAFTPTGEVRIRLSASFDATRVRGPNTNLSVRSDGRWGGTLAGQSVRLQVTPTRISGGGVTLTVAKEADKLTVQGNAAGGRVRIIATKTSIDAQVGKRTFNATRDADGNWRQANQAAGATNFRFTGTAADPLAAPMPQWVFAVIGAL